MRSAFRALTALEADALRRDGGENLLSLLSLLLLCLAAYAAVVGWPQISRALLANAVVAIGIAMLWFFDPFNEGCSSTASCEDGSRIDVSFVSYHWMAGLTGFAIHTVASRFVKSSNAKDMVRLAASFLTLPVIWLTVLMLARMA